MLNSSLSAIILLEWPCERRSKICSSRTERCTDSSRTFAFCRNDSITRRAIWLVIGTPPPSTSSRAARNAEGLVRFSK